ncbi:ribonuclease H-like domain-containing protein [Tanacetum coccineum]|uniref:Ribonuclease H-like domain-containing protein n=1 Tax=Tanacetum coccineum TaxID=301880 RepID=A0ABQ5FW89_9ASTR
MKGYKLKDLKLKEFDSIQEMFDRAFKRENTFEDFRTELVEGKEKRAGVELVQEVAKKQKGRIVGIKSLLDAIWITAAHIFVNAAQLDYEESHRVASGSTTSSFQRNQASTFVSNVLNRNNFQKNQNFNNGSRPNNVNNNRQNRGSGLVCEHCGINGHTIDICFKLIGYPADFGEKNLVGHPNETEAFISKIRNLRLSNGLVLYDVLVIVPGTEPGHKMTRCHGTPRDTLWFRPWVIPEYRVTLISVHKLAKDNKIFVAFDESRCFFELGFEYEKCYGDWLGHLADPVLNVLKTSLQFDNKNQTVFCEICQRAKKTREPFPLSDHISKLLDDLVHLYLWGPYKVTSFEGFRYFLTVVDDYTRVVWLYLIKYKDEVPYFNTVYYNMIENQFKRKIEKFRNFPDDNPGNDAQSSDDIFATQDEQVTTLEENIFSKGNLDQNSSTSNQDTQTVRRSSRQSVFPRNYNDFVVDSKTDAMNNEMDALLRNDTWDIVDLPKDKKVIGSKWIFKIKYKSSGEIDRYKARLVAQGFNQKEGIDYEQRFSLIVKMVTIRCLLNIVVSNSWHVFQLDVNNAFLYGDLVETVYMKPPEGYFLTGDNKNGFSQSKYDYSLYTKSDKGVFLALLVFVDDIIITSNSVSEIDKFKVFLKSKFMIKDLGKLIYFLGIEFMHFPLKSHLMIAFKILRFLKGSPGLGIHIIKNSGVSIRAFSDVDWVKCVVTRKSMTGYYVVTRKCGKTIKVESANQIADILTKGLDTVQHKELVNNLVYDIVDRSRKDGGLKLPCLDSNGWIKPLYKLD